MTDENTPDDMEKLARGVINFGPCCICERPPSSTLNVNTMMMMDFIGPQDFQGWGCLLCNLPSVGAIAVLCDDCAKKGETEEIHVKYISGGKYVAERERILLETFNRVPHVHNRRKHPEIWTEEEKKKWGPDSIETRFNVYHPSGAIETGTVLWPENPSLKDLHGLIDPIVGGNLEHVRVFHEGEYADMFVYEFSCRKPLQERNEQATAIYRANTLQHHPGQDPESLPCVRGVAVLFDRKVWS
jgi:hypothetical protein